MFVQKLILFLTIYLSVLSTKSQDAGLPSMIYPVANQKVHLMFDYDIQFIIKNYGSSTIASSTPITFTLLLDGQVQTPPYSSNNHPAISPGDSLTITIPPLTLSTPNPTLEICMVSSVPGDNNPLNDTICTTVRFSIDNNIDLRPTSLDIIIPDKDSVLDPGEFIFKMQGQIENIGSVTLPKDYIIKAETKVGFKTQNPNDVTTTAFEENSFFTMDLVGQFTIPEDPGPFPICITLIDNPDDINTSNDEYCQVFYSYDWTGMLASESTNMKAFNSGNELFFQNVEGSTGFLRVFSADGRLLIEKEISLRNKKGSLNISELPTGVYILNLTYNNSEVYRDRFVID